MLRGGLTAAIAGLVADVPVTVRDTRGREIDGACGQLAATVTGRSVGPARRHAPGMAPVGTATLPLA